MKSSDDTKNLEEKKREEMLRVATAILDGTFDIKGYYGLTDGGVEAIYVAGYEFFQHKKYEQAQQIFSLLCFLDNSTPKFYYAYGAASFMLKQYFNAEIGYRAAMLTGDYTPKLFLRLAEACLWQNKIKETEDSLNEVMRLSQLDEFKDSDDAKHAASRASLILEGLKRTKAKAEEPVTANQESK
ncbi:MAG: tetratricopeptide repeat protein [Puniceicoccales bacterium]|jgi:hypothetical protein|nr:tetratricopeptide repeat protein [Puniceicoccales bacterium]